MGLRHTTQKLLEIGLGCTMSYGPGASAALWRKYMPHTEIWMAEYNGECVATHDEKIKELNINMLIGDQSDTTTLHSWVNKSGGQFDIIIDDGGHTNMQQYNSFIVLFVHGLKPGGIYFLEDLMTSRTWIDGDSHHVTVNVILDWVNNLAMGEVMDSKPGFEYKPTFLLPPGLKSIDCFLGACVFTKCFEQDTKCPTTFVDNTLATYSAVGTSQLTPG